MRPWKANLYNDFAGAFWLKDDLEVGVILGWFRSWKLFLKTEMKKVYQLFNWKKLSYLVKQQETTGLHCFCFAFVQMTQHPSKYYLPILSLVACDRKLLVGKNKVQIKIRISSVDGKFHRLSWRKTYSNFIFYINRDIINIRNTNSLLYNYFYIGKAEKKNGLTIIKLPAGCIILSLLTSMYLLTHRGQKYQSQ